MKIIHCILVFFLINSCVGYIEGEVYPVSTGTELCVHPLNEC